MSDTEITRLCAEAMGLDVADDAEPVHYWQGRNPASLHRYDPLHDDAQAMALVKRFDMVIERNGGGRAGEPGMRELWAATLFVARPKVKGADTFVVRNAPDLNRAICECVAKLEEAKRG